MSQTFEHYTSLNILHVTPSMSPEWGGPVVVVSELIPALANEGICCEILTTRGHRVGSNIIDIHGVSTHVFDTSLPTRIWTGYSRNLTNFLDNNVEKFDLVHIHEIWHYPAYAAYRAAKRNGIPIVLTSHGELSEWRLSHKGLKKRVYRKFALDRILRNVDCLHAITKAEKERIRELGFNTPVVVAPNGTDPASFDTLPDPSAILDRFPSLKGKMVVLYLGRLNPTKGLDILARAFSTIAKRFPDSVLLVAGPDEEDERTRMESILISEGTLDKVIFTGMLTGKDKLTALSCADLFVLPSYSEGFSVAVLEAMAARLPVVITEGCNFPEVMEHGAGFVVAPEGNFVANAIIALLSDPELRTRMGENGRKLVAEHYTWQATASKIAGLYRRLARPKDHKPIR